MFIAVRTGPALAMVNAIAARPSLDVAVHGESGQPPSTK